MTTVKKTKPKKTSLEQFVKDHHYMFAVLGVFGGLTALFTRLENASYLAFLSFIIFLLLDLDLWVKFPKSDEASLALRIFEVLLQIYLIAIGVYLVQAYSDYVAKLLPLFFTLIFAGIFLLLFNKFKLFKPIREISPPFRKRSTLIRMVIGMSFVTIVFILALVLGTIVAELIKYYFQYPPTP